MLKDNKICTSIMVVGIAACMLISLIGILLKYTEHSKRDQGGDIMVKRKRNPYSFTVKKNDKHLPVMSKEQVKEALASVEKYIIKKTI